MSQFTGLLGTQSARPGNLMLGAGPAVTVTYNYIYAARLGLSSSQLSAFELGIAVPVTTIVTSTVAISETIDLVIVPHLRWFLSNTITVSQTIRANRDKPISVIDTITITEDRHTYGSAEARLSQYAFEVVYNTNPQARLTSYCIEVVYKKATAVSVTDTITVTSAVHKAAPVRVSVTDVITVTADVSRVSGGSIFKSVSDTITVTPTIGARSNIVHIRVSDTITGSETDAGRDDHVRRTRSDTITATEDREAYPTPRRIRMTQIATASEVISIHDTKPRANRTDTITVQQAIGIFNPNIAVRDSIHILQTIGTANTKVRITVNERITVTQTPAPRNDHVRLTVNQIVTLPDYSIWTFIQEYVNPRRITQDEIIHVTDLNWAGLSDRDKTIQHPIHLSETIRCNFIKLTVVDTVQITEPFIVAGLSYPITVAESISIDGEIGVRANPVHKTVTDSVIVRFGAAPHAPILPITVTDTIRASSGVSFDLRPKMNVADLIRVVEDRELRTQPVRITVPETVTVIQSNRFTPVRILVHETVTVDSKPRIVEYHIRDTITVTPKINRKSFVRLLQSLNFSETVSPTRSFARKLTDNLVFNQNLSRNVNWNRTLTDELIFFDGQLYPKDTSLGELPLPVVVGVIVPDVMTLKGQHGTILLIPPLWGDQEGLVATVTPKQTMSGLTYTFVKTTDRRKVVYPFKLTTLKYIELRAWIIKNADDLISITDWKGGTWVGRLTKLPADFEDQAKASDSEWVHVELEFEAIKTSG